MVNIMRTSATEVRCEMREIVRESRYGMGTTGRYDGTRNVGNTHYGVTGNKSGRKQDAVSRYGLERLRSRRGREIEVRNEIHSGCPFRRQRFGLGHLFRTRPIPRVPLQEAMFVLCLIYRMKRICVSNRA